MTNKELREYIEDFDSSYATSGKNKAELLEMYNEIQDRKNTGATMVVSEDIEEPKEIAEEPVHIESKKISYTKTKKNPFFICGVEIDSNFIPSAGDLKKKDFLKKLNYAVKIGLLKQG